MLYQPLLSAISSAKPVRAAVIGAGTFGSGIVQHSRYTPALNVCAVADANLESARQAYVLAGATPEQIAACDSLAGAQAALQAGKRVITTRADILFPLPLDIIAEATGVPEAGALHAQLAIEHRLHVAMITKETDAAVGPMLKRLADRAGVVYTAVDGDQHGMLAGLAVWAQTLGLEILCAAKALDGEIVVDDEARELEWYGRRLPLTPQQAECFAFRDPTAAAGDVVEARRAILGKIAGAKPWDLVELCITANSTNLAPDIAPLHCPPCWTSEIPEMLCTRRLGGLLSAGGRIDAVQVLRRPHEASLGGGVMLVVRVRGQAMREIMRGKGMICHRSGETAVLMLPHHMLGIEAIGSMLAAALLRQPTGAMEYAPRFDVIYRAAAGLAAGSVVGDDHDPQLTAEIVPALPLTPQSPLPAGLARGNRLLTDIAAGAVITGAAVQRPASSVLWQLREAQQCEFSCKPA